MPVSLMAIQFHDFLAYATHMRAEHERLRACVGRIEREWKLRPREADSPNAPLVDSLISLRAELARHFEEEECGGCIEEAVSHCPNLSQDATRLEQEHSKLLTEVDGLIEQLRGMPPAEPPGRRLTEQFQGFTESLRAHEAEENRILEESFGVELE